MISDEAANCPGFRFLSACLILLATLFLAGLAALLWFLADVYDDDAETNNKVPPFCCPDAIETITTLSNLTNDPCTDFVNYACYRKSDLDQKAIAVRALTSTVLHPTLHGRLRSPAGGLLVMHYRSCLTSTISNLFLPENAIGVIIDIFRRWSRSPGRTVDLLRLVGMLHFRYNVISILKWLHNRQLTPNVRGPVIGVLYAPEILNPTTASFKAENDMFTAAQRLIGRNILREDISSLIARFRAAQTRFDDRIFVGPLPLLDEAIPNANMSSWKDALSSFDLIGLEDPLNIRHVVEVLMDESIAVQEAALIYFSIHSAYFLFEAEVIQMHHELSITARASFCDGEIVEKYPLWDMVSTEQMTCPERDSIVLALFDTISAAVLVEAENTFSGIVDVRKIRSLLGNVHVVLAKNLTAPYGRLLPKLSANYFENKFLLREFLYQVRRVNDARGLQGLFRFRTDLFQAFVARSGMRIAISASIYSLLSFKKCTSGGSCGHDAKVGATIINAAVLGVMIADALWDALLANNQWPPTTRYQLFQHLRRLRNFRGRPLTTSLKYPTLSLRATLRAVSTPRWHRRTAGFGVHSLSASQVFFVLFLVHHSCHALTTDSYEQAMRVTTFVRNLEEFCEAFGCTQTANAERNDCRKGPG